MPTEIEEHDAQKGIGKGAVRYFLFVLLGSLLSAFLGGGFGALVATVSPEFVKSLFSLKAEDGSAVRYASAMGMIWGLFIGVGVSCFACLLTAIVKIIRLRIEHKNVEKA